MAKAWINIALCFWHPGVQMIWFSFKSSILKYLASDTYSVPSRVWALDLYLPLWCALSWISYPEPESPSHLVSDICCWPSPMPAAFLCECLLSVTFSVSSHAWSTMAWILRWVFLLISIYIPSVAFSLWIGAQGFAEPCGHAWSSPIWNKNIPSEPRLSILLHRQKLPSKQIQ